MGKGAQGTHEALPTSQGTGVLTDKRFAPFQDPNFSVAAFTSNVLAGSHTTAHAQSEELREGVRVLDTELAHEVTSLQLLKHVRRMLDAERSLGDVVLSVESLQSAIRRIRAEITGPYEHIKTRTRQLKNLHDTVELIRHLIHRIKLTQKLRAQMATPPGGLDLAKAAKILTDIRAVDKEADLSDIDAVTSDEEFIATSRQTIQEQAEAMLKEGMESMSQAKVGSALQVFFNLEELSEAVQGLLASHLHKLEKLAKAAVDARQLNAGASTTTSSASGLLSIPGSSRPAAGLGTGTWQDKLWVGLKELADSMAASVTAVWHLQRVVAKKKDPLTHVCFLDELVPPDQPLLTQQLWNSLVRMLSDVIASLAKPGTKSGYVRDALIAGYPKLAAILETMFDRLVAETTIKGVLPAAGPEQLQQLLGATASVQSVYLGASLNRVSEAVLAAFPGGMRSLASPVDIQKCISMVHEELKAGSSSPQVAILMAQTAGKALDLLSEKAEYMASTGPDVRAVSLGSAANSAQLRNIALSSQLQEVYRSLSGLLARLPPAAAQVFSKSLDTVQATAIQCVAPIFKSVMEALEDKLVRIHTVSFAVESADGMTSTSSFITESVALINHFRSEYLSKFVPPPSPNVVSCVGTLVERMAARALIFFVRHASLVRPLSQVGRLQLAKDMAELQLAVGGALFPLEQLGQPYRVVKAFRSLLFIEPGAVLTSSLMREMPPSMIVHHLFTRLEAEVQAPHERSGLTPAQYSRWLDTHNSGEVLRGVQGALEAALHAHTQLPKESMEVVQVILHICRQPV